MHDLIFECRKRIRTKRQQSPPGPEIVLTQGGAADASTGRLGSTVHHGGRDSGAERKREEEKGTTT